jgi:hypothetical protein
MTRTVVGFDYPAHISVEKQRYGFGTQTHLEKKVILEKWYSDLRGYLPELYKEKMDEYNKDILPLLHEAHEFIEKMEEAYSASFESLLSCNPDEKQFNRLMRGCCECLDEITAKAHILDKVRMPADLLVA